MLGREPIKRSLFGASDKYGLLDFAQPLAGQQVPAIVTEKEAKPLINHKIYMIPVADYTGFPDVLEGRVKSPKTKIHRDLPIPQGHHNRQTSEHEASQIHCANISLQYSKKLEKRPGNQLTPVAERAVFSPRYAK